MLLATILQCSIFFTIVDNVADEWRAFFEKIEQEELEIPQDQIVAWSSDYQTKYETLLPWIVQARNLAMRSKCDWETDFSLGFNTLLPQLAPLRNAATLINFSVQRDYLLGDIKAAMNGLHGIFNIAVQQSGNKSILEGLVYGSIFILGETNMQYIDQATDPMQLQSILDSIESLNDFDPFGLRQSVAHEGEFISAWLADKPESLELDLDIEVDDFDVELTNYKNAMNQYAEIFKNENQEFSSHALEQLNVDIEGGKYGQIAALLVPSLERLLAKSFEFSENVANVEQRLREKINQLIEPNAATYLLQAVNAYVAIDSEVRAEAIYSRDFTVFEVPFALLQKAALLEPVKITLSGSAAMPQWVAPLYCLTKTMLVRGEIKDCITAVQISGHLSNQERLAPSLAAGNVIDEVVRKIPYLESKQRVQLQDAMKYIPFADSFMIISNTRRDLDRLNEWSILDEELKLGGAVILQATTQFELPIDLPSFDWLLTSFGFLNINPTIKAAIAEEMPEALRHVEIDQEKFQERLERRANSLKILRKIARGDPRER